MDYFRTPFFPLREREGLFCEFTNTPPPVLNRNRVSPKGFEGVDWLNKSD